MNVIDSHNLLVHIFLLKKLTLPFFYKKHMKVCFILYNRIVKQICYEVDSSIQQEKFLTYFRMSGLPFLSERLEKFLKLLVTYFLRALLIFNAEFLAMN